MTWKIKSLLFTNILIFAVVGCGGGGGGESPSSGSGNEDGSFDVSGKIVFEQAYSFLGFKRLGVSQYDIDSKKTTLIASGIYPTTHADSDKIIYLQECHSDTLFEYYRVVYLDAQSMIHPVTGCSIDIPNPTTGVPIWEDLTDFIELALSPDESYVAVTLRYDRLNEAQNNIVGFDYEVWVYDLAGTIIAKHQNAYDPSWLPDGRLMFVYGQHFYITDQTLQNHLQIDDGDVINSDVYNPSVHPDGEYFIFQYNLGIWRMNIDGSGIKLVIQSDKRLRYPRWNPQGTQFVYTKWTVDHETAETRLWFYDLSLDKSGFIVLNDLQTLGEPWGTLSWIK